eukprot:GHVQ01041889.1.p1 GENE.GHVQ01041889.1~~GHVQ01041889.1.p1  ORF type:complete len:422 (+),score=37.85 GHVQ01041889.1:1201-2466(+)
MIKHSHDVKKRGLTKSNISSYFQQIKRHFPKRSIAQLALAAMIGRLFKKPIRSKDSKEACYWFYGVVVFCLAFFDSAGFVPGFAKLAGVLILMDIGLNWGLNKAGELVNKQLAALKQTKHADNDTAGGSGGHGSLEPRTAGYIGGRYRLGSGDSAHRATNIDTHGSAPKLETQGGSDDVDGSVGMTSLHHEAVTAPPRHYLVSDPPRDFVAMAGGGAGLPERDREAVKTLQCCDWPCVAHLYKKELFGNVNKMQLLNIEVQSHAGDKEVWNKLTVYGVSVNAGEVRKAITSTNLAVLATSAIYTYDDSKNIDGYKLKTAAITKAGGVDAKTVWGTVAFYRGHVWRGGVVFYCLIPINGPTAPGATYILVKDDATELDLSSIINQSEQIPTEFRFVELKPEVVEALNELARGMRLIGTKDTS